MPSERFNLLTSIYFVFPVFGLFYTVLEYFWPIKPQQLSVFRRAENFQDLLWLVASETLIPAFNGQLGRLVVYGLVFLNVPANAGGFNQYELFNWSRWSLPRFYCGNPWLQFILIFLVIDLTDYLMHRYLHRSILWRVHMLHHSAKDIDWMTSFRSHWIDDWIFGAFSRISLLFLASTQGMIFWLVVIDTQWGFINHANVRLLNFGPLQKWINNPIAHQWHHADRNLHKGGQNFGNVTLIWDQLFGTYYQTEPEAPPITCGVPNGVKFPLSFWVRNYDPVVFLFKRLVILKIKNIFSKQPNSVDPQY